MEVDGVRFDISKIWVASLGIVGTASVELGETVLWRCGTTHSDQMAGFPKRNKDSVLRCDLSVEDSSSGRGVCVSCAGGNKSTTVIISAGDRSDVDGGALR